MGTMGRSRDPEQRPAVTDAELAVLEHLWSAGPSTIRELTDALYPGGTAAHYSTVQKLLERLEAKECVERRPRGRANVFHPRVERGELIASRLRETADRLCGGSLAPLLTQLVDAGGLTADELESLRRLVAERGVRRGGGS